MRTGIDTEEWTNAWPDGQEERRVNTSMEPPPSGVHFRQGMPGTDPPRPLGDRVPAGTAPDRAVQQLRCRQANVHAAGAPSAALPCLPLQTPATLGHTVGTTPSRPARQRQDLPDGRRKSNGAEGRAVGTTPRTPWPTAIHTLGRLTYPAWPKCRRRSPLGYDRTCYFRDLRCQP